MKKTFATKREALASLPLARYLYVMRLDGQDRWAVSQKRLSIVRDRFFEFEEALKRDPLPVTVELFNVKSETLRKTFR